MTTVTKARRRQKSKARAESRTWGITRARTAPKPRQRTSGPPTADTVGGADAGAGTRTGVDDAGAGAGVEAEADAPQTPQPPHPAEQAFDLLYARHARALARQAYLLCGHRRIAEHAVEHAFHLAWERWPEVALDEDPVRWLRAATHDYALSPWHQFHPRRRKAQAHAGPPADRELLDALVALPRPYRRAVLLHDGLGMSVAETAAESEATGPATLGRIFHAHQALGARVPELRAAPPERHRELITERLRLLADAQPVRIRPSRAVRVGSEHTTRRRTRAAHGLTAVFLATVAATLAMAETRDVEPTDQPGPAYTLVPAPGPEGGAMVEDTPKVYAPHLRSSNERVHLDS